MFTRIELNNTFVPDLYSIAQWFRAPKIYKLTMHHAVTCCEYGVQYDAEARID